MDRCERSREGELAEGAAAMESKFADGGESRREAEINEGGAVLESAVLDFGEGGG